jgi:hypothetical protein
VSLGRRSKKETTGKSTKSTKSIERRRRMRARRNSPGAVCVEEKGTRQTSALT